MQGIRLIDHRTLINLQLNNLLSQYTESTVETRRKKLIKSNVLQAIFF